MILIGYPGIGKSTLVEKLKINNTSKYKYIDLESSNFHNGSSPEDWYKNYIKVAIDLSNQGYFVFVSCHKFIRDELHKHVSDGDINHNEIAVIYPKLSLKDRWIDMLEIRLAEHPEDKNKNALSNVMENYDSQIEDLMKENFHHIEIVQTPGSNYDLNMIIEQHIKTCVVSFF